MSSDGGSRAWALAAAGLSLWALCFAVRIENVLTGTPLPQFLVAADPGGGPPTLVDFRAGGSAEEGLAVGDRLLRLGNQDLTGVGPLGLFVAVARAGRAGDEVVVEYARGTSLGSVAIGLRAAPFHSVVLPMSLAWAGLALLILLRSSWTQTSRYAFWASLGVALCGALLTGSLPTVLLSLVALPTGTVLMAVFGVLFLWSFPFSGTDPGDRTASTARGVGNGARLRPPRWPWLFAVAGAFQAGRDFGVGMPPVVGQVGLVATLGCAVAVGVSLLTRKRRWAQPLARAQLQWVLAGVCIGGLFVLVGLTLLIADRQFLGFYRFAAAVATVLPAAWAIAILRYRTFDVQRVFSAATTYSIAGVALLAVGVFTLSALVGGAQRVAGGASIVFELLVSATLIALFVPFYRQLRQRVERLFLRDRIALRDGIWQLIADLSRCREIDEIWMRTGEGLDGLIAPSACALYVSTGRGFAPIFCRGAAIPAAIPRDGSLVAALHEHRESVDLHLGRREGGASELSVDERRVLDVLNAAVVVPIKRRGQLHGFIVLGERRSGDLYTVEDRLLFDALAQVISAELERVDDATLATIGERMAQLMNDLREPLDVMSGHAAVLTRAHSPGAKEESIDVVLSQFRLMQRMVGDVLAFARGETPLLARIVHVGAYLEELRTHLASLLAETSVSVRIIPGFTGDASFDATRLTQAIETIAGYAVEGGRGVGQFTVETSADPGRLIFTLSYEASGMPQAPGPGLFAPFSSPAAEGGIASRLATVSRAVALHKGEVMAELQGEEGVVIRIALPLFPADAPPGGDG